MSQAIIYTNELGGVSVCIPTGELSIEQVQLKDTPVGSKIVNVADLPNQNNDFFDAWEMDADGKVTVNKAKAVEITKKRLRAEREPLLAAQDVAFQRALESSADTTAIVAEKQRLRDVTDLATASKSLETLRGLKAEV
jgi:hypothetical protein